MSPVSFEPLRMPLASFEPLRMSLVSFEILGMSPVSFERLRMPLVSFEVPHMSLFSCAHHAHVMQAKSRLVHDMKLLALDRGAQRGAQRDT